MKKYILLSLFAIGFYSCDKDLETLEESEQITDTFVDEVASLKSKFPSNKAVGYRGRTLFSGTGYDPAKDFLYRSPAFIGQDINFKIDNGKSIQFFSEISIVKNNREFEAKVKQFDVRNARGELIKSGVPAEVVNGNLKLTESTATILAKVSFKTNRYEMDRVPRLTQEAVDILNSGASKKFLDTYGPMYIQRQDLGGDLYFFYTYRVANYNSENRSALENKVRYDLALFLNAPGPQRKLSDEERRIIENNLLSRNFYSNLKGYKPLKRVITSVEDFEREKQKVIRYVNQKETRAATTSLKLAPYTAVLREDSRLRVNARTRSELTAAYNSKYKCYRNLQQWNVLKSTLVYIRNNTQRTALKNDVKAALANAAREIGKAKNCNNSNPPPANAGEDLKARFNAEVNR